MHLLYVEDEMSVAKMIGPLLRNIGYSFDSADCGLDAIDLAKKNRYDLILLDIMLPDIDGFEVIERLRQAQVPTPILVQTGLLDKSRRDNGASLGVEDYLIKPFNRNELMEAIEKAVARPVTDNPVAKGQEGSSTTPDDATDDGAQNGGGDTLNSARVVWPFPFNCVILNMSSGGAIIRVPDPEKEVPVHFILATDSSTSELNCEVCWRLRDKIGINFVSLAGQGPAAPEPEPLPEPSPDATAMSPAEGGAVSESNNDKIRSVLLELESLREALGKDI